MTTEDYSSLAAQQRPVTGNNYGRPETLSELEVRFRREGMDPDAAFSKALHEVSPDARVTPRQARARSRSGFGFQAGTGKL